MVQMLQTGSTGVEYSVWYSDKLRETQRFFANIEKDLKEASNAITIDYTDTTTGGISVVSKPFKYKKGNIKESVEIPENSSKEKRPVILADTSKKYENSTKLNIIKFTINHPTIVSGPNKSSGYTIEAVCSLKRDKLLYTKKIIDGSLPTNDTSQNLFTDKVVLTGIKYIYISHRNLKTKLTKQVKGALVYIYIVFENDNILKGSKKTLSVKQSFKINVPASDTL